MTKPTKRDRKEYLKKWRENNPDYHLKYVRETEYDKKKRVGYATTSYLEHLCLNAIKMNWEIKDYAKLNEYLTKYSTLHNYNKRGKHGKK